MQKITVKEVKGPLGKGDKKFYAIKDGEGAEFTTFDTKVADLTPGSIIEAEVVVKGKYLNLGEWKLLEAGTPSGNGQQGEGRYKRDTEGIRYEYNLKAYLENLRNASIEAQTAFNGIVKLAELVALQGDPKEVERVLPLDLWKKGLAWAESRLDHAMQQKAPQMISEPPQRPKKAAKQEGEGDTIPGDENASGAFANVGQLMKWALDNYGITRDQFMQIVGVDDSTLSKVNLIDAKQAIEDHVQFESMPSAVSK